MNLSEHGCFCPDRVDAILGATENLINQREKLTPRSLPGEEISTLDEFFDNRGTNCAIAQDAHNLFGGALNIKINNCWYVERKDLIKTGETR